MKLSGADVVGALKRSGFMEVSQKGSHQKLRHADGRVVIVPMHRELKRGTLQSILRQAKMSLEDLTGAL